MTIICWYINFSAILAACTKLNDCDLCADMVTDRQFLMFSIHCYDVAANVCEYKILRPICRHNGTCKKKKNSLPKVIIDIGINVSLK